MALLFRSCRTSAARRSAYSSHIQIRQDGFSINPIDSYIHIIWQTLLWMTVERYALYLFMKQSNQQITQADQALIFLNTLFLCEFKCCSKSYDSRNIQCSRAQTKLLTPTMNQWMKMN